MKFTGGRYAVLAALAVVALAATGCGDSREARQREYEMVSGVALATARVETVPAETEAPGTVRSAVTAEVAARTMGTITRVLVSEGQRVRRGQPLVELDAAELSAREAAARSAVAAAAAAEEQAARGITAAEAHAEVATKTFERFELLRQRNSVSAQEFDEVAARRRAADAALAAARAQQQQAEAGHARAREEARAAATMAGYARVVAPFDGIVVRRHVDAGAMAAPGMPLVTVEQTARYRLEATVDAAAAAALRTGMPARVALDAFPGESFEGRLGEIEAGADPGTHTVRVKVDLPAAAGDAGMRSGLFGRAWFARGERQAMLVPVSAVVERGQLRAVFIVDGEGVARLRLVTLGRAAAGRVEVLSGLRDGERYVTEPGTRELEGKRVEAGR
jgi:multidrug efflux system membrane fusion protein